MWDDDPRSGSPHLQKFTSRQNRNESRPNLVVCAPLWDGLMRGAVGVEQLFRYRA